MPYFIDSAPDANGGFCRKSIRTGRRCQRIGIAGCATGYGCGSTPRYAKRYASRLDASLNRAPPSLTARASGALKKGASRSAGLRRRQEDQGQETSHPRRRARLADARHRARRRRSGPRRRRAVDGDAVRHVSILAEALCRRRLSGADLSVRRSLLRQIDVEIVKRSDTAMGFAVLPKRWIVDARTMSTG